MTEDELIARFLAPMAGAGGLSLKDDAALFRPTPGHELVMTADGIVAGVHFFPDDPPQGIARKALAVNVSDLAAKGAEPRGFLLTLGLPTAWTPDWLEAFCAGLAAAVQDFGCPLLGGDTVRSPLGLVLSVAAFGETPQGTMVRRTTAQPGDAVCVTGTIGDAALGLALRVADHPWAGRLDHADRTFLVDRYLHPQPRLALAAALREHASAAMDVSDGLAGDLAKMLRASGVTATVQLDRVPLSDPARRALAADPTLLDRIVTGGDDYEILLTVPPVRLAAFQAAATTAGVPTTVIGEVREGEGPPVFRDEASERRYARGAYSHF